MRLFIGAVAVTLLVSGPGSPARAEYNKETEAILDKAIKALGGEENLKKVKAATWKAKGKISMGGMDNEFTSQSTVQGLDHYRTEFEGDFMGNKVKGVSVLAGDKGWRQFGDRHIKFGKDALANEKRFVYLLMVPLTVLPLKEKGFKVEAAGEEKVGDEPAVAIKVTGPDGKDFKLFFDKASGLPVKQVAKRNGIGGEEFTQETTYRNYKDFAGIKCATKIEALRDGGKFLDQEITEFKVLDNVDPKTFAEPQ